jgi:small-conductance mechanosensitive channel/CRP-like cAMP-binding protein
MSAPAQVATASVDMSVSLVAKALEHRVALTATIVFLVLLVVLRAVLPAPERARLRFPFFMLALYLTSIPVRAAFASYASSENPVHEVITLVSNIGLAFGIITTSGLLLFNVLGGALSRLRILRDITQTIAGLVAVFVLLSKEHVNVLSIVTTSAVLTAVLGLAFQDTLGNILSGVALQVEATMSIGDWITVGEVTGQVTEIRWRSTAIVTRNDDLVVIPNSVLAKATIANLTRPYPWHRQWVQFDVHYRHPPNEVQQVVLEALHGLPNVKAEGPAPDCILYRMEQDHAHYAVRYRLLDLRHDDGTDSEVRKRIWYALRRHGIEIPYPSRNIFMTELNSEREQGKWERERTRRLESLRKVDLFAPLDDQQRDLLAARLTVEVYGAGEVIIGQGQPGDSLYLVRHGQVGIHVALDQLERQVATLGEGQFFGEMSLMTGERRHATVVAKVDTECYVINRDLFQQVLAARGSLVNEVTEILARRQEALRGEVEGLGAEARKSHEEHHADLLERITRFFGLRG